MFTKEEVKAIIKKGHHDGAPGPNGVPAVLSKEEPQYCSEVLAQLYNNINLTNTIPTSGRGFIIRVAIAVTHRITG